MNATRWVALAGYVRWLGSKGKREIEFENLRIKWFCQHWIGLCEIEETEKGWYITLIDKDPDSVRREMESEKKEKMDLDDEQRRQQLIEEQVNHFRT